MLIRRMNSNQGGDEAEDGGGRGGDAAAGRGEVVHSFDGENGSNLKVRFGYVLMMMMMVTYSLSP